MNAAVRACLALVVVALAPQCLCVDAPAELCSNKLDDDGDGDVDCADPDCTVECGLNGEGEGEGQAGEGEGEGEGAEGEGGEGEGEGEGAPPVCLAGGTALVDNGGSGQCNGPKVLEVPGAGTFTAHTGVDETNGQNANLDSCLPGTSARDVVFQLNLPAGVTALTTTVDANGGTPAVKIHEGTACNTAVDQCGATDGDCAFAHAIAGTDFTGTSLFVSVSELVSTTNDYTLHVEVEVGGGEGEGEGGEGEGEGAAGEGEGEGAAGEGEGEGGEGEGEGGAGEGEGEGAAGEGEGEGGAGEGEGEGAAGDCLVDGSALATSGTGACNAPLVVNIATTGVFAVQTTAAQFNGVATQLDACSASPTARDVAFKVNLPAGTTALHASVDGAVGSPIVKIHSPITADAPKCADDVNQCAADNGTCASARATAGVDFTGSSVFVTVSETIATTNDYTLRLEVE